MSRKNRVVFLAVVGLFCVVLCIFSAIRTYGFVSHVGRRVTSPPPDPLEARLNTLAARYKNGEIAAIDISTVTTFSWDNLYLFGSYTDSSDIASIFGPFWSINNKSNCSEVLSVIHTDSSTLLVFSNKGAVVHCFAYEKESYYLMVPDSQKKPGYSPQEALFVLDNQGRMVLKGEK